jgi:hypothetical protein
MFLFYKPKNKNLQVIPLAIHYVVLSPASEAASCHGFWVKPLRDSSTEFIQPVRLTT